MIDIAIIGNGAVGMNASIYLKTKLPKKKITLFGNKEQKNSASVASGAMLCPISEQRNFSKSKNLKFDNNFYYQKSCDSIKIYKSIQKKNNIKNLVQARGSIMFIQKEATPYEKKTYEFIKKKAKEKKKFKDIKKKNYKNFFKDAKFVEDCFIIKDEYILNTKLLFNFYKKEISRKKIEYLGFNIKKIRSRKKFIIIKDEKNIEYKAKKVILAAGPETFNLLDKKYNLLNIFQGVGIALETNNQKRKKKEFKDYFVRTVSSIGTGCGFHFLQRDNQNAYVGAGNYLVSINKKSQNRLETAYWLTKFYKKLVTSRKFYKDHFDIVKGSRARAIDDFAMIGELKKEKRIFIATGLGRTGVSISPKISNYIYLWHQGKKNKVLKFFAPDRKPNSFGTISEAKSYYIESIYSALKIHEMIKNDSDKLKKKLALQFDKKIKALNKKFRNYKTTLNPNFYHLI